MPPPPCTNATGTKVGTINVEQAIFATNEGQRDFEALSKKLEPKQTELKSQNDEVEALKKQLNTQGEKLNDDSRATLVKQIEQKQKSLERVRCRTRVTTPRTSRTRSRSASCRRWGRCW